VSEADADQSIEIIKEEGYTANVVGEIRKGGEGVHYT
jgi:phosphoribosylaminoimidazole (AIR) synthetase